VSKRKRIVKVEHELIALDMATSLLAERPDELIEYNYSDSRAAIEEARVSLIALGMYEQAKRAVDLADEFRKQGNYAAASKTVYATYRELMRRSGTDARYAKKYRGLSEEEAGNMPKETPEDVLDEVQPDVYSGLFIETASEQERRLVFAVEDALFQVRHSISMSGLNPEEDLPGAFAAMRDKLAAAERPLSGLGLYQCLLETLAGVEEMVRERRDSEADEDLIDAAELLADRCGLTALRQREFASTRARRS
jgi:hypothetical protein